MIDGAEEAIAALRTIKEMDPGWKMCVTGKNGKTSEMTTEDVITHLKAGDEFARNFLDGLGQVAWALMAGTGIPRPRTGPLSNADILSAIKIVEDTSLPQTVTVIPLGEYPESEQP